MNPKLLIISDDHSRIVLIKIYLESLFLNTVDMHIWSSAGTIYDQSGMYITEDNFQTTVIPQYTQYQYDAIVVDTEENQLPRGLHNWHSHIKSLVVYLPAAIPRERPLMLVIPTNYHLLQEQTIRQLQWLIRHTGISLRFIHMNVMEETMESLYDPTDDRFTEQIRQHFEPGSYSFRFPKNNEVSKALVQYIREIKPPFILGIPDGGFDLFRHHLSAWAEDSIQQPYIIF